jgi:hypothetical protein
MKKYKENESQRDEFYAENKKTRLTGAKIHDTGSVGSGAPPSGMFDGEDLAIARKREAAEKISHSK